MAFDEYLADRVRQQFTAKGVHFTEKKMMGGIVFMVDEKMCLGVDKDRKIDVDRIMVRVGPDYYEEALEQKGVKHMDFTGRPMKGFVFVGPDGFDADADLSHWIDRALAYNPFAKSSKRKNKKKQT